MIIVYGLLIIFIISSVEPLRLLQKKSETRRYQDGALRSLIDIITTHSNGRRLNAESFAIAKAKFKAATKHMSKSQIKKWLRNEPTEDVENENEDITNNQASVVEKELEHVLEKKSSVFEKPHLEKFGQNDFLVMDTELEDKFVTVIPNAIFYNVEKKCVNWLDDCSLQGIRDRLLRGVKSP